MLLVPISAMDLVLRSTKKQGFHGIVVGVRWAKRVIWAILLSSRGQLAAENVQKRYILAEYSLLQTQTTYSSTAWYF